MSPPEVKREDLESYFQELHRFGERLGQTARKLETAIRDGKFPREGHRFEYAHDDPKDSINRSVDITRRFEFLVAVTGAFSSGKSTLLNVLLDSPDLLPSSAIPLTAVCTVIRHGHQPRLRVRHVSKAECFARVSEIIEAPFAREFSSVEHATEALEHPGRFVEREADQESLRRFARFILRYDDIVTEEPGFEQRHAYIAGGGVLPVRDGDTTRWQYYLPTPAQEAHYLESGGDPARWVTREWLACIRDVTLSIDSPLLENNRVFLDLPGLNCREDYHRRAVREYCNRADCILLTAFQPGNQADEEVIDNFRQLSSNYREKLFFVLNRIDQFQTEPEELVRAFDYLSRHGIGEEFPRERCFLTSAYLARESLLLSPRFEPHFESFRRAFTDHPVPDDALARSLERACSEDDPGGMVALRESIHHFLEYQAYPVKIAEVLGTFQQAVEHMKSSAEPRYAQALEVRPEELRAGAIRDYYAGIQQGTQRALSRFQDDLLAEPSRPGSFARDLETALKHAHRRIHQLIQRHFDSTPDDLTSREDPVSEFEVLRRAEDASRTLRGSFLDVLAEEVTSVVEARLAGHLETEEIRTHLENLFHDHPQPLAAFEKRLVEFGRLAEHTLRCCVRARFQAMPSGRDLRRLTRPVPRARLVVTLTGVFGEFYPDWIFQNIYGVLREELAPELQLEIETLGRALGETFHELHARITSGELLETARLPEDPGGPSSDLYEVHGLCRTIDELDREQEALSRRRPQPA